MTHINDHLVNLYSGYGNNGSSPLVRTKTSASSYYDLSVNSHSTLVIIYVFDSSELERFSCESLDRETPIYGSSFDSHALLSGNDARSDRVVGSVPIHPIAIGNYTFPYLTSLKVEATSLKSEEAHTFIITYQFTFGRDLSDVEIWDHHYFLELVL